MNVNTLGSGVVRDEVLLDVANARDGALESLLDEHSLLRVHHLVVALFKFPVDVDVLDIERGQVLEDLVGLPACDVLHTGLVLLSRQVLNFDL